MDKKGVELSLNIVIIAVILLIVAGVVIYVFTDIFSQESSDIKKKISLTADSDKDGVIDMFDKCPCDEFTAGNENPSAKGCPTGKTNSTTSPPCT